MSRTLSLIYYCGLHHAAWNCLDKLSQNTTARIENSGKAGRIHVSDSTAGLIREAGKGHWLVPRDDKVQAKGKGAMQTYWVEIADATKSSTDIASMNQGNLSPRQNPEVKKVDRLIEWNVEMFTRLVKQVVAHHQARNRAQQPLSRKSLSNKHGSAALPLDEVKEIIALPEFDHTIASKQLPLEQIVLDPKVVNQLRNYITDVSKMYFSNPFHNFDHAR